MARRLVAVALLAAAGVVPAPAAAAAAGCDQTAPAALHRGASEFLHPYTENTLRAAVASWRAGADMVELDVRFTRTGSAVLMHDATVDRTTDGSGRVARMTGREVRRLRTTDGGRVPYLSGVLRAAREGRRGLVLEVKTRLTGREADGMVRAVRRHRMTGRVIVTVWNDRNARAIESRAPGIRTARYDPAQRWRLNVGAADMYVLAQRSLTARNVDALHAAGVGVVAPTAWLPGATTLRETYAGMQRIGVDVFITAETRWYTEWRADGCPGRWS